MIVQEINPGRGMESGGKNIKKTMPALGELANLSHSWVNGLVCDVSQTRLSLPAGIVFRGLTTDFCHHYHEKLLSIHKAAPTTP